VVAAVSRDFEEAYAGLRTLVGRIVTGEVGEEVLREAVDDWRREDCRGAAALSKAAALSLRYDLASGGLRGGGGVPNELRALGRVEKVLDPRERTSSTRDAPVEVALPEALRRRIPGARGFRMGELQILLERGTTGGVHASVSHPRRSATWDELMRARIAVAGPETPTLWAWMPPPGAPPQHAGGAGGLVHLYDEDYENRPRDPRKSR
jgi:hypothetical protein